MEPHLPPSSAGDAAAAAVPEGPAPAPTPLWQRARDAIAPLVLSLVYLLSFVCVQILVAQILLRIGRVTGTGPLLRPGLPPRGELFLLIDLGSAPFVFLVTLLFLRAFHPRRTLASLGLRWPSGRGAALREAWRVPLATIGFLLLWMAALEALPLPAGFRYGGVSAEAAGLPGAPLSSLGLLVLLLITFLIQGATEEWMLRGYVYQVCKERWTVWGAIAASSLLFAALHAGNPSASPISLLNTFLIGVILALLVESSGSLWGATLAHGVWNFSIACLLSLPVSGFDIFHLLDLTPVGPTRLTGRAYGPEASLIVTVIALPVVALLLPPVLRRQRSESCGP